MDEGGAPVEHGNCAEPNPQPQAPHPVAEASAQAEAGHAATTSPAGSAPAIPERTPDSTEPAQLSSKKSTSADGHQLHQQDSAGTCQSDAKPATTSVPSPVQKTSTSEPSATDALALTSREQDASIPKATAAKSAPKPPGREATASNTNSAGCPLEAGLDREMDRHGGGQGGPAKAEATTPQYAKVAPLTSAMLDGDRSQAAAANLQRANTHEQTTPVSDQRGTARQAPAPKQAPRLPTVPKEEACAKDEDEEDHDGDAMDDDGGGGEPASADVPDAGDGAGGDSSTKPIPKRKREKTLAEKAAHARFMRFSRSFDRPLDASAWIL